MNGMLVLLLIGSGITGLGVFFQLRRKKLLRECTESVPGEVHSVDAIESSSTDSDGNVSTTIMYHPVFSYKVGEQTFMKRSNHGTSRRRFRAGDKVTVCFAPGDPDRYYVAEDKAAGRFNIILIVFGAVIVIISFFVK